MLLNQQRKPPINIAETFAKAEAARTAKPHNLYLSHATGTVVTAISTLIMAYPTYFKIWPILLFFTLWFFVVAMKGLRIARPSINAIAIITLPLLCCLSSIWSDYPRTTLYLGTAFLALNLCTLIFARTISTQSLLTGLAIGINLALLITLADGTYQDNVVHGSGALIGLLGSKNQVGFLAEIGILTALIALFTPDKRRPLLCIPTLVLCSICLALSQSDTSIITLVAACVLLAIMLSLTKLPHYYRIPVLTLTLVLMALAATLASTFDAQTTILKQLGKDSTLTGRTYLWDEGIAVGKMQPLLGHGYSAFWVKGNPQAERYWHEFYIESRRGFHFHSTYIQAFVDLGIAGLALITVLILASFVASLRAVLRHGYSPETLLLLSISTIFLLRSSVEIDFFTGPFSLGALLFYAILPRLAQLPKTTHAA